MKFFAFIKVGDNEPYYEGMVVDYVESERLISPRMRKTYAIVELPFHWLYFLESAISPLKRDGKIIRARAAAIKLERLQKLSGHLNLIELLRGPGEAPILRDLNIEINDFFSAELLENHGIKDTNEITRGNYTIGMGGDFATWALAIADIGPLIGDLTLLQVGISEESAVAIKTIETNGNEIILDSNKPHLGNPADGFTIRKLRLDLTISADGSGHRSNVLVIKNLINENQPGDWTDDPIIALRAIDNPCTIRVRDLILNGSGYAFKNLVINRSEVGATFQIWNTYGLSTSDSNFEVEVGNSKIDIENCVAFNTFYANFIMRDFLEGSEVNLRNNVATNTPDGFIPKDGCYNITKGVAGTLVAASNLSQDATAPGSNPYHNINILDEYKSLIVPDAFFELKQTSWLAIGGAFPRIPLNTHGINGNERSGGDDRTSVGAGEFFSVTANKAPFIYSADDPPIISRVGEPCECCINGGVCREDCTCFKDIKSPKSSLVCIEAKNRDFISTGFKVRAGEIFNIIASGLVDLGGRQVAADGIVIMKVLDIETVFKTRPTHVFENTGLLWVKIDDNNYDDNLGTIEFEIIAPNRKSVVWGSTPVS